MIDVKRKIDVPDRAICIHEQRPEIKIVDDDSFEPAIDSSIMNRRNFFLIIKNDVKNVINYFSPCY